MKSVWLTGVVLSTWLGAAQATDLNVQVTSPSGPTVRVGPGAAVPYGIVGELSNASSDGLALFSLDLSFNGGPLTSPLGLPVTAPMDSFSSPKGFTNPAGFGGTLIGGILRQVGGGQNTINNTLPGPPTGTVITNVAQFGSPITLGGGQLTAPYLCGTYSLAPSNVLANVLTAGHLPADPFWKVEAAGVGAMAPLSITVQAVRPDRSTVSPSAGQFVDLSISAGPANAGRQYKMVGCWSGTTPGTTLPGGMTLPLNNDRYLEYTTANVNGPILQNSQGTLDANGRAVVTFHPTSRFEGLTVHHAFYVTGPINFVSEAESVLVVH